MKIAHIVNPVIVPKTSDLYTAQPVTFESMRLARAFARGSVEVQLLSAQYAEDRLFVPTDFERTPDLERSVIDVRSFSKPRKLPLIKDILDRLYTASPDADALIYTNVDIGVLPHFYVFVARTLSEGTDAFIINKRLIPKALSRVGDLPLMYTAYGEPHSGYDCFIFKRELTPRFRVGNACIGIFSFGWIMALNLQSHAKQFKLFANKRLTFHLGNDRVWENPQYRDYTLHNKKEYFEVLLDFRRQHLPPVRVPMPQPVNFAGRILSALLSLRYLPYRLKKKIPRRLPRIEENDIFIASYPRSGNTWVRFLIASLLTRETVHFRNIDRFVPDLHKKWWVSAVKGRPRFIKSHIPCYEHYPKSVYIVRDGRDALVSFFHYHAERRNFKGSFSEFVKKEASEQFGTWAAHVSNALQFASDHPSRMLIVRYEDLLAAPLEEIKKIASFCGLPAGQRELERAVERCSFKELRRVEQKHGPETPGSRKNFFREGRSGQWKDHFSENDLKEFMGEASAVLKQLGYAD